MNVAAMKVTWVRRVAAVALTAIALACLVLISRVAWQASAADTAELRLSWRTPAPSYRQCRPPTEAEVSGTLPHMRPTEVCADRPIAFRLTVQMNGDTLHSAPVERSGRRARTITIFRSFPVAPGSYALEVNFEPELPPDAEADMETEIAAGIEQGAADTVAGAPRAIAMTLSTRVSARPGDVILVSPDENGRLAAVIP